MNSQLVQGLHNTINFARFRREDETIRAGANAYQAALAQAFAVGYAFKAIKTYEPAQALFGRVLSLGPKSIGAFVASFAIIINAHFIARKVHVIAGRMSPEDHPTLTKIASATEVSLNYIDHQMQTHFWLRRSIYFIHDNIGTAAQIAIVAASVGLFSSGGVMTATVMLLVVGGDFLCQKGLLPFAVRTRFYPALIATSILTQLVVGGYFEKAFAIAQIAYVVYKKAVLNKKHAMDRSPIVGQRVKGQLELSDVEVDVNHIRTMELKPVPEIDLKSDLFQLYDELTLDEDYILRKAETDDTLVKEIRLGRAVKTYEDVKTYIEDGLKKFAERIVNHRILLGEPTSEEHYNNLSRMAKSIIVALKNKDEMTRHDAIVSLGLIGHYCGSGFFREVGIHYQSLVDFESETLQGKVLTTMRNYRDQLFYQFLQKIQDMFEYRGNLADVHDIHVYNQFATLFAPDFGLTLEHGTRADHGAKESPSTELLMLGIRAFMNRFMPNATFRSESHYNIENICKWFNSQLQPGGSLNYIDVENWFIDWLSKDDAMSREEARNFFGTDILDDDQEDPETGQYLLKIERGYLLAMLVEMGVLKVKNERQAELLS